MLLGLLHCEHHIIHIAIVQQVWNSDNYWNKADLNCKETMVRPSLNPNGVCAYVFTREGPMRACVHDFTSVL